LNFQKFGFGGKSPKGDLHVNLPIDNQSTAEWLKKDAAVNMCTWLLNSMPIYLLPILEKVISIIELNSFDYVKPNIISSRRISNDFFYYYI
jgi:hypothetical protein